jgi:quinol monooxygenase YgiN
MFIAIIDFTVTAGSRQRVLAELDSGHGEVSVLPGNLDFRVYASREDDNRVTIVHEWQDEASFDAYLKSAAFARFGEILRPVMSGAARSRRFRAELLETVA